MYENYGIPECEVRNERDQMESQSNRSHQNSKVHITHITQSILHIQNVDTLFHEPQEAAL